MSLWPETVSPLERAFREACRTVFGRDRPVDPLAVLRAANSEAPTWDYEFSHVGPLPTTLHAKQLEARASSARHRFLFWANQSGKTSFCATEWCDIALGRHPVWSAVFQPPVTLWASRLHQIDELVSQRENFTERSRRIEEMRLH